MVRAVQRGVHGAGARPARFALVAFGGNGLVYAAGWRAELGIGGHRATLARAVQRVGLLVRRPEDHLVRSVSADGVAAADARARSRRSKRETRARCQEGYSADRTSCVAILRVRYAGQSRAAHPDRRRADPPTARWPTSTARFEAEHERTYGHRGDAIKKRAGQSAGDRRRCPIRRPPRSSCEPNAATAGRNGPRTSDRARLVRTRRRARPCRAERRRGRAADRRGVRRHHHRAPRLRHLEGRGRQPHPGGHQPW